jgi:uncharacterized protein (DUF305 family)
MRNNVFAIAAVISLGVSGIVHAQDHAAHGDTDAPAAAAAFQKANADMHKAMDIEFSGNADRDFVRSMIPHHEGAVAMARIVLDHGKDPELRVLAEDVIRAQEAEIKQMKTWLERNPE